MLGAFGSSKPDILHACGGGGVFSGRALVKPVEPPILGAKDQGFSVTCTLNQSLESMKPEKLQGLNRCEFGGILSSS